MSVPPWPPPHRPEDSDSSKASWQALRDILLFLGGLAVLVNELVLVTNPRLEALIMAAAMLGLPAVFRVPTGKDRED